MSVRLFDWRDLPVLLRYRRHGLYFDTASFLTRGPMRVPAGAMLSYLAPATGIFTYLATKRINNGFPILGQVTHRSGLPFARLSFLAPEAALESSALPELLEYMITQIGKRGAFHLLAEVDERSVAFEVLRRASFAIYVRQRIWQLNLEPSSDGQPSYWRAGKARDIISVRSLYNNLVPGLVQQVEPPPNAHLQGLVYMAGDEMQAHVEVKYGPRGIWVQPFIHPDAGDVSGLLCDLLHNLPHRRARPVYLCVRSYQSWLEPHLKEQGAEAGPIQAVMVKHLAISQRVARSFSLRTLEGGQHEATAPFVRSESKKEL
ncbi:MAG TPA: hypothetical protein VGA03_08030 [Anaerolineales bacterium]